MDEHEAVTEQLDEEIWEDLKDMEEDEPGFINELVKMFLDQTSDVIGDLETANLPAELNKVDRSAHKLRGSASQLGLLRFQVLMKDIMLAAREKDEKRTAELLTQLPMQWERTKETLASSCGQA